MQNRAYAYLLLTMLFWGGNSVAGKLAVGHVSPMILVTLRWVLALAVLGALGWRQLVADWPAMRRHLPMLCALAVCGFTFFNALFYTALAYTTAINVSIEQAGMPVLIILINFLLFRISVTWLQLVGVLATIAGVAITACHGDPRQLLALRVNVGDGMMLVAVVLYSGYTVFLRFKPDIHWKSLMLALAFFSFVTALPFAFWEIARGKAMYPDGAGWAVAIYVALFPSAIAQILYIRGNDLIGGNRAGLFINLVPIFGTLLSVVIIGEDFQLYHALAIVLVLGGIWLAEHSGRKLAARTRAI
jgi:drug/metabolite transporter (DMT)-like permease